MGRYGNSKQDFEVNQQLFGKAGSKFLSHTNDEAAVHVCAITVIEDAVLHATTSWNNFTDGTKHLKGDTNSVTIPAGITIYGEFDFVKLDSGSVLCYYAA
tara:strand:- start:19 stop:318 length:300 start_codon:yes stop_codon:yes gene_type:complete